MVKISKKEKAELLFFSKNSRLRDDMQAVENIRRERLKTMSPDEYLKFLGFFSKFTNYQNRKFEKIEGENFKL
ncbi:MAG: hypothetical protein COS41_06660 [Elusimicrobia bacterium CG03_land_8_20_14_0_80_50_18]|nr:MAG: hypothetical protein COS41_06660 [Elusimicrobia bacterium CG03_land_8_20_14_0_80_50_18]